MSLKNSNLHAKIAANRQIALFNYFCLSELFATLYSSKKFGQTKLIKKSNLPILEKRCMQDLIFQSDFVSQGCMKKTACKICQNGDDCSF